MWIEVNYVQHNCDLNGLGIFMDQRMSYKSNEAFSFFAKVHKRKNLQVIDIG